VQLRHSELVYRNETQPHAGSTGNLQVGYYNILYIGIVRWTVGLHRTTLETDVNIPKRSLDSNNVLLESAVHVGLYSVGSIQKTYLFTYLLTIISDTYSSQSLGPLLCARLTLEVASEPTFNCVSVS